MEKIWGKFFGKLLFLITKFEGKITLINFCTMKKLLVFCFIILCCKFAYTQTKTTILNPENILKIDIKENITDNVTNKPIRSIEVIDSRDDTSSLGYDHSLVFNKTRKYVFDTPFVIKLTSWISNFLKTGENKSAGYKLLVCIRKLRISEEVAIVGFADGHQGQPMDGWESGVMLKAEFYINDRNFYYPMYRFDSIITVRKKLPKYADEYLSEAFKVSLSKLFKIDMDLVISKAKKMTLDDILVYNNKRDRVPILNDSVYKKGAYASFDEFKLNNPSILDIEYKKGKMGDMLYVRKDGLEYPDRTVWGFSDGKSIFINSCDKFSELIPEGFTFYFKGIKGITKKTHHKVMQSSTLNFATNTGPKKTVYKVDFKYYQIDMDTGEVY